MIVYMIDCLMFLVESIFGYLVLKPTKNAKTLNIKSLVLFSCVYMLSLGFYDYFSSNQTIYRILSALIFFIYFYIESIIQSKNTNQWKFLLTYSFFINTAMELTHFISFEIVIKITENIMKLFPAKKDLDHNLIFTVILIIYAVFLFIIYKLQILKSQSLREISNYKFMIIVSPLSLLYLVYIKYCIKQYYQNTYSEEFCLVLSNLLLITVPVFLFINIMVNKSIEKSNIIKNKDNEEKIKSAIEHGSLNVPFDMQPKEYEQIKEIISKKINNCGIYNSRQGFSDIVFSVMIIKYHLKNEKIVLSKNVYPIISKNTGDSVKLIDTNIRNTIKEAWLRLDPDTLTKEYTKPIDSEKGYPTAKEFLTYIANNLCNN